MLSFQLVLLNGQIITDRFMDAETKDRVQVKIFVGVELKANVAIFLNKSSRWKEAKVSKTTNLKKTRYQNREYIGIFLSHEASTMKMLQKISKEILEELQHFCPESDLSHLKINIFPQIFVA